MRYTWGPASTSGKLVAIDRFLSSMPTVPKIPSAQIGVSALVRQTVPGDLVVVTFDDGHRYPAVRLGKSASRPRFRVVVRSAELPSFYVHGLEIPTRESFRFTTVILTPSDLVPLLARPYGAADLSDPFTVKDRWSLPSVFPFSSLHRDETGWSRDQVTYYPGGDWVPPSFHASYFRRLRDLWVLAMTFAPSRTCAVATAELRFCEDISSYRSEDYTVEHRWTREYPADSLADFEALAMVDFRPNLEKVVEGVAPWGETA